MQTKPTTPLITLNDLHFILVSMPDVFCQTVCEACNWTEADYHFHLKHPGHISHAERKKINQILNNLLMITYAEAPKLSRHYNDKQARRRMRSGRPLQKTVALNN